MPIEKRNWKPVMSGRIYQLYLDVMNRAKELKLWKITRRFPPLYLRKSSRSVGEYVWKKLPNGIFEDAIVLNTVLLDVSDDAVRSVIVHEVAHAIRPRDKHNANWARIANMLGDKWGYKASVYDNDESILQAITQAKSQKIVYKYELYCPTCGNTFEIAKTHPGVKNPEMFVCKKDSTPAKVRKIKVE